MSMYSHRNMGAVPPGNARLNELLEQIRAEFDNQQRQTENFEHQGTAPLANTVLADHCARLSGVESFFEKRTEIRFLFLFS